MRGRRGRDDASAASVAVLSHEAHVLRILASPVLDLSDLGRAACVCRAWRAAVGRDDTLFEAALRRDSPALAAARTKTLTCRALAAAVRGALGVPRSRAPAWAQAAVGRLKEWTLVADLYVASTPNPHNVFSVAVPVTSLTDQYDDEHGYDFDGQELCACARHVTAPAARAGAFMLRDLTREFGADGMTINGPAAGDASNYCLRLLALHRTGRAAVICTRKEASGVTRFVRRGGWLDKAPNASCMRFDPAFGTGPRVVANFKLFPSPSVTKHPRAACLLGFSYLPIEKARHYDGPDSASESASEEEGEEDYVTQQGLLRTLILAPLRWTP